MVVRFVRGPKGFLDTAGDVYMKVFAQPLRAPGKHSAASMSAHPRAGVLTWTEPLSMGIFRPPCKVEFKLMSFANLEDNLLGEGQFDLPTHSHPKRYKDIKLTTPAGSLSKRLQTDVHIEYSVEYN
jgi:hypothetical protein